MKLIVGSNIIEDCDAALVLGGEEVFKVQQGQDDQWLVSFDVRDESGQRLAKIVKNQAVHVAPGYRFTTEPSGAVVVGPNGAIVASARAVDKTSIEVTGTFCVGGAFARATKDALTFQGVTMTRNYLSGNGTAFRLG